MNVVKVLAVEHRDLMVSRKEAEIDRQVKVLSNPMSKKAVDHDLRLLDCVSNIKKVLMIGPNLLVATSFNFEAINRALALSCLRFRRLKTGARATMPSIWSLRRASMDGNLSLPWRLWRRRWDTLGSSGWR